MSLPPRYFSPGKVDFQIKKIPLKKSPSFDLITGEIIRHLQKKTIVFLTQILNSMIIIFYQYDEQPALKMKPIIVPKREHPIRNIDISEKANNF